MKKYLPFIILGLGLVVFVIAFLVIRKGSGGEAVEEEESNLLELELVDRPVISLTPTEDGHYLILKIDQINVTGAVTMDFQFLYDVPDKVQQGSSGDNIDITSGSFETDLLLGSESAGKYRFDEGVERGNLTIWFRNNDKKLITKLETDFVMKQDADEIASSDGKFIYMPEDPENIFVVMNTLGLPKGYDFDTSSLKGPYGVFSAASDRGKVEFGGENVYRAAKPGWEKNNEGLGIYVSF